MLDTIIGSALGVSLLLNPMAGQMPVAGSSAVVQEVKASESLLTEGFLDMNQQGAGYKENILLVMQYLNLDGRGGFTLLPGEMFAFHKSILPEFQKERIITQKSTFMVKDGYKTVFGLQGNGVCNLASLMNKVASQANLEVTAPTKHNFAAIPGIEKEYGTSIYFQPKGDQGKNNLYIKNNQQFPLRFAFRLEQDKLLFSVYNIR